MDRLGCGQMVLVDVWVNDSKYDRDVMSYIGSKLSAVGCPHTFGQSQASVTRDLKWSDLIGP